MAGGDLDRLNVGGGDLDLCFSELALGVFDLNLTGFLATGGGTFFSVSARGCLVVVGVSFAFGYRGASSSTNSISNVLAGLSKFCKEWQSM